MFALRERARMFDWVRLRYAKHATLAAARLRRKVGQTAVPGSEAVTRRNVPMRWNYLTAALLMALPAANGLAEAPNFASDQTQAMSLVGRARFFPGQNW